MSGTARVGIVVIGRNEGERLVRCLKSLAHRDTPIVYVDSGSTDGSPVRAAALGAHVIALDLSTPFTAARARNAGFSALLQAQPQLDYVQFVDGDCEVHPGWIPAARAFLDAQPVYAVACGRRRERHPEASIYNRLCDMEWDTPVGEAKACGGDALMRVAALRQVGGFRDRLIAGEEPELCVRLRAAGWKVYRLDAEMTLHDAAITKFSQWWRRNVRAGYAFAEGASLHGARPERHWVKERRSALLWGLALPAITALASTIAGPAGLLPVLAYPAQIVRLTFKGSGALVERALRALFLVLGKFPEAVGELRFAAQQFIRAERGLIEYK
jgi:GT2 family glycosyltransferase